MAKVKKEYKPRAKKNGHPRDVWIDERIEKECKQLDKWSRNDDALTMLSYCAKYDILQTTLLNACEDYQILSEAYKAAKIRVGARREVMAMKGEINAGLVQRSLRLYNSEQDKQDNSEIYQKAYNDQKGRFDAAGIDKEDAGEVLDYIRSQKVFK